MRRALIALAWTCCAGDEPLYVCSVTYGVRVRAANNRDAVEAARVAVDQGKLGVYDVACGRAR